MIIISLSEIASTTTQEMPAPCIDVASCQEGDVTSCQEGDVSSCQEGDVASWQEGDVSSCQEGDVTSCQEGDVTSCLHGNVPKNNADDLRKCHPLCSCDFCDKSCHHIMWKDVNVNTPLFESG